MPSSIGFERFALPSLSSASRSARVDRTQAELISLFQPTGHPYWTDYRRYLAIWHLLLQEGPLRRSQIDKLLANKGAGNYLGYMVRDGYITQIAVTEPNRRPIYFYDVWNKDRVVEDMRMHARKLPHLPTTRTGCSKHASGT